MQPSDRLARREIFRRFLKIFGKPIITKVLSDRSFDPIAGSHGRKSVELQRAGWKDIAEIGEESRIGVIMKSLQYAARNGAARTVVQAGSVRFGEGFVIVAGPCSVESEDRLLAIARAVKAAGADALRGGAFKPRTSPYAFQGLGLAGLRMLEKAREETGLPIITEVLDPRDVSWISEYADVLQIGARNMQNFSLLKEAGKQKKPVLLKRGLQATLEEWLNSAEYILSAGNPNVILCERGIRTFETYTRNTLDLSAVPAIRSLSHLPILVDPTHGTGRVELVEPMSLAAAAAGADGLMIEVHDNPEEALSDKSQALLPDQFRSLVEKVRRVRACLDEFNDEENPGRSAQFSQESEKKGDPR